MFEAIALLTSAFWMLMIFDCLRNDPERNTWIWILIFLHFPGAVIYFLIRRLPQLNLPVPNYFRRWMMRDKLWTAEAAVRNIGKSHQYVNLGNVLLEMGDSEKAEEAFTQALDKEPKNTHALWGCAYLEMRQRKFDAARAHLETLLKLEADYKCGEASLLYGKALFELPDWEAAKIYLEKDIKHWSHPEASIMLATIQTQEGNSSAARNCLENMLAKVRSSPTYHYRRHQRSIKKAEKLLKTL
jgi:hypothetical protein